MSGSVFVWSLDANNPETTHVKLVNGEFKNKGDLLVSIVVRDVVDMVMSFKLMQV